MPAWLGITLAGVFAVLTGYRLGCRDAPAALMGAGMAVMAAGMGGIGPHLVHGPWWALGFALVALWPVLERLRATRLEPVPTGHLGHLVGGVAMVHMCVAGLVYAPAATVGTEASATEADGTEASATVASATEGTVPAAYQLAAAGHHHGGHTEAAATLGSDGGSLPAGLFALAGWLLACYFLLATITALTRRGDDGGSARSQRSVTEATMGLGTMIMLVAML